MICIEYIDSLLHLNEKMWIQNQICNQFKYIFQSIMLFQLFSQIYIPSFYLIIICKYQFNYLNNTSYDIVLIELLCMYTLDISSEFVPYRKLNYKCITSNITSTIIWLWILYIIGNRIKNPTTIQNEFTNEVILEGIYKLVNLTILRPYYPMTITQ